ncbi:MAG: hypothetical protein FWC73_05610 [Defluviitaleaceae bacterium]|nr:hypothetical protein [Defluviitaleaceae bacterium]
MRYPKPKKYLMTAIAIVASIGLLSGCNSEDNTYQPASNENVRTQDSPTGEAPVREEHPTHNPVQAQNLNLINTTFDGTQISSSALSKEEAAQVGARYIMDIFGESIDGMYVELEFSDWEHLNRSLWSGAVSFSRRNTLEQRARLNELNDEFMARYNAGEDPDDINADLMDSFLEQRYTLAHFYFTIDAITGKRIDIRQTTPTTLMIMENQPSDHTVMDEYIEREWGGDWGAAFEANVTPQEIEELSPMALAYAQKHFHTTTVVDVAFESAFATLIYVGNSNFDRVVSASFLAIDETGREAIIAFEMPSRVLTSLSTFNNDFIPIEFEEGEGREFVREEERYNDTDERRAEQEEDQEED